MTARLRVLLVGAFPPQHRNVIGGNVTACRVLMQSSFSRRLDLELLDSTQISNPPPPFAIRLPLAIWRSLKFIVRIERNRPDLVLLFVALGASVAEKGAMAWYARLRGIPAVLFPRGGELMEVCRRSHLQRLWTRFAFSGAAAIFCQGKRWQRFAIDVLRRTPEAAPVIPNWTATPELLALGRAKERVEGRPVRLLFLGWLEKEKGVAELIEACRVLAPSHDFRLSIGGEGKYASTARETVHAAGLSDRVVFEGWLDERAVRNSLAQNDILVLPSWYEGLPNVLIEAMCAGLAVIATRVGSIPDYVVDGENGLLVEPRDSDALASAMARLIEDPELRDRISAAGREMVARSFGVDKAVDLMLEEFRKLTDSRRGFPTSRTVSS